MAGDEASVRRCEREMMDALLHLVFLFTDTVKVILPSVSSVCSQSLFSILTIPQYLVA
jgi:hypothetical protein